MKNQIYFLMAGAILSLLASAQGTFAQPVVAVSNLGDHTNATLTGAVSGTIAASPFTVGPQAFDLTSAEISLGGRGTFEAYICRDDGGNLGGKLYDLGAMTAPGILDFQAPAGSMLDANTTYWLAAAIVSGS